MSLEFLLTSIIVVLLPGTGVLYTLAIGLGKGWRASILAALGCTLGIIPAIIASVAGLAALLHTSALAFQVIKYLGVAYLFYMAWCVLRDGGGMEISEKTTPMSAGKVVFNGFFLNILNPKLSLFFLAFLPQFVPVNTVNPTATMLGLAAVFMLLTFVVFIGYGAFAAAARHYVVSKPGVMLWLKRGFAGAFGLLGLRLALSER
ncbi:LysE family translocator [Denitrobaculum tricleocarpae]|uniref:LysE family translocator n=1 Tax=Denitrobaculum tricleocarpae TaxID=2591009 RepID=A0A545TKT6_9PROT|nr:LysE family translocator [Denitrobaculum tricleocarpae]TQV77806.1 LysE family translocator [Denitrobaculum tricleocarpae]